jgi:anti-sigma-K factor RskA
MSDERCLPYRDNLAAYALGALDADELRALESHLADCQKCQSELADYQSIASGLLELIPPQAPPARLRSALIDRLPSHQPRTSKPFANIFWRVPLGQVASTVALLLLLGLNVISNLQIRELQQRQSSLAERLSQDQTAIAMLAYPSTQARPVQADVENLAGSMLVDKDKRVAVLVLWNLPQVESGQTYQVWLIDSEGGRTSGGLFRPLEDRGYTTATIWSPQPLEQYVGVGVTVEPEGGSEGPTGSRVLGVDL